MTWSGIHNATVPGPMIPRVALDDLVGVPWARGGRMVDGALPLGGLDCWGLVVEVRRRAGLWTPDPWGCGVAANEVDPDGLPAVFTQHMVTLDAPRPYCAVQLLSRWSGGHAGVYLPDKTLLHGGRDHGVVREPLARKKPRHILGYVDFRQERAP